MLLITVSEAKAQCRIEPEMTDEDALLTGLIEAAISHIQSDINKPLVAVEDGAAGEGGQSFTPALKLAALLLIGHWYTNREAVVTGTIATTLPLAYDSLIHPYRDIVVG
ncbi:head-tail connector protein [Aeromonas media]|uniref:head-tail connector protein n=1 Tax=Aeromonas media TaxID=651 RepID=UPI0038D17284